jgi:hypothetical protein
MIFAASTPASVKGALRSVPREFDTRPVSMNLHHPAAIDFPEKSDAVTMHSCTPVAGRASSQAIAAPLMRTSEPTGDTSNIMILVRFWN